MTIRRMSPAELSEQHRRWDRELEQAVKERNLLILVAAERRRMKLREGIVSALLIMAGIVGAAGLLYFRAQVWAWATGDPVTFAVVLFMLAVGSLLTIRAAQGR